MSAPKCPHCGATMVKRLAKRGANAGNEFWGCPNFPNCKTGRPLSAAEASTALVRGGMNNMASIASNLSKGNTVILERERIIIVPSGKKITCSKCHNSFDKVIERNGSYLCESCSRH